MRLISRLFGGIGNQLFIYASTMALAEKLQLCVRFDTVSGFHRDIFQRQYALSDLGIAPQSASSWESFQFPGGERARRYFLRLEERRPVTERHYLRQVNSLDCKLLACQERRRWLYIEGYWQDFRFFHHTRSKLLCFAHQAKAARSDQHQCECRGPLLGIHVRQQPGRNATGAAVCDLQPGLDKDYYMAAARIAIRHMQSPMVLLFGDDLEFRQRLAQDLRHMGAAQTKIVTSEDAVNDLRQLASCDALVLSGSTFAWWAGYLNSNAHLIIHPGVDIHNNPFAIPSHWMIFSPVA